MEQAGIYDARKIDHLIENVSENELSDLAELFKIFGDSTRIKILFALFHGEKNVTEICEVLEMNQSAVSHQLKTLKDAHLVKSRREGKQIYYSICDHHIMEILDTALEHIREE